MISQMIALARPMIDEEEVAAVRSVLLSGQLAQGEQVALFERRFADFCQVRHAIAVSSGTAALHIALLAHGIGPGDEVITTSFSFAATANTILLVGATPVFVDIDPATYTLDPRGVEQAITARTKAIMPVHLYGYPADMRELMQLATRYHLHMIEDACQAHGASIDGQPVGSFGTGCFSFYATKNMTTAEGGMVTMNDDEVAARVRLWCNHGQTGRYHHVALGFNYRMTNIQAALGLVQLDKLPRFDARRAANAQYLTQHLEGHVQTPVTRPGYRHVYHQYTIRAAGDRDTWVQRLHERGIATGVHYPRPIHRQPVYQSLGYAPALPETERAAQQVISLPVHPGLTEDELALIVQEVTALCQ